MQLNLTHWACKHISFTLMCTTRRLDWLTLTQSNLLRRDFHSGEMWILERKHWRRSQRDCLCNFCIGSRRARPMHTWNGDDAEYERARLCVCFVRVVLLESWEQPLCFPSTVWSGWQESIVSGWLLQPLWASTAGRIIAFLGARHTNDSPDRVFQHFSFYDFQGHWPC